MSPHPSPSTPEQIRAARVAPDRAERIRELADLMREQQFGTNEGLSIAAARAAGFSSAEIEAYRDEAMALARSGKPFVLTPPGKCTPGDELVRQARAIRRHRSAEP